MFLRGDAMNSKNTVTDPDLCMQNLSFQKEKFQYFVLKTALKSLRLTLGLGVLFKG